jgi:glycosyltransferase involved in cell wall biosynthesis
MQPTISIIIPTYNEENFLPKLLHSIRKQEYRDKEVIVADANSTDRTRAIAEEYGAKVVEGGQVAEGRNNGAKKAKGDIFLFLDADVVMPDAYFLEFIIKEFERKKLGIATCLPVPISDSKMDHAFHNFFNVYTKLLEALTPHASGFCILVRRAVHEAINGFDEEIKLAEDHDYAQKAAEFGKFGILRSRKIPVSIRRFEKDGRLKIAAKYFLCELHRFTLGSVKTDIFNYKFGYGKEFSQKPIKNIKE